MIQELLGGGGGGGVGVAGGGGEERKVSINGGAVEVSSSSEQQNLKCPRCDSSNTKFCYYNNYNLTQPRHFCKTCRRYWTKGGALRNVPIGGGCRKNKGATVSPAGGKSSTGKAKPAIADVGQSNSGNGFDPHLPSNPLIWSQPQNLLALLRATHNPNPNPNLNSVMIKEEKAMIGSHMAQESLLASALYARNLNLDPPSQIPIGLSNSLWRNNHHHQPQLQGLQNQPHQQSMLLGEVPNSGIQDLYQKFRSPSNYYADHSPAAVLNNSTSSILETTPVTGGQLGYWNSPFSWSDLPTANGAFP